MPPAICKAYPIAILVHGHCAIDAFLPTPLLYALHHTILAITISCRGQLVGDYVSHLLTLSRLVDFVVQTTEEYVVVSEAGVELIYDV